MDKSKKKLNVAVLILVILMGSIPALLTIFNKNEGDPFGSSDEYFWATFILAIISIIFVVLVSYYLIRVLFRRMYEETESNKKKSITVGTIVLISGVISLVVGVEFLYGSAKIFGWGPENFLRWSDLLVYVPLMTIGFSIIPVLVLSIISGIISFFYLTP